MRYLFSLIFLSVFLLSATQEDPKPRKLALVVAIGQYASNTGWNPISSINDIRYIRTALNNQGFADADIDTLKNEQATYKNIVAAIDRLIEKAKPGDIVVFHYSGHGQQIFDDANKDEKDGYDEALVPYDAPARYGSTYHGENHLRDDELGAKLKKLRQKISSSDKSRNGSLLVLLDACHSGTGTRGQQIAVTRGTAEKLEPEGYEKTITRSRGAEPEGGVFDDKELLSNMVVISAASAEQLNYETKDAEKAGVGALSYAFSRALSQTSGLMNYKILFEKIRTDIQSWTPAQNPQIEGNTDQQVLGGSFIKTPDIIRISKWNADGSFEIPRGTLHAVMPGAEFSVYAVDVTDFKKAKPLAAGKVLNCLLSKATCKPESALVPGKAYNVVMESRSFGEMGVAVKIGLSNADQAALVKQSLAEFQYVSFDKSAADLSLQSYKDPASQSEKLQLVSVSDSILWEKDWSASSQSLNSEDLEKLKERVKLYSRAQYLRSVQTPPDAKVMEYVQVDIIPGKVITSGDEQQLVDPVTLKDITDTKGNIIFKEYDAGLDKNDGFVLKVRNLYDYPVYISIVDIMPDNSIAVLFPDPSIEGKGAEEFKVAAKDSKGFLTPPITLAPPYGRDHMKIIISRTAMDLKGIEQQSTSRGNKTSFEAFFNESVKGENAVKSRGPQMPPVKVDEIKIVPFTYVIEKREGRG